MTKTISILAVLADRDLVTVISPSFLITISILAVLADRDNLTFSTGRRHTDFNPRGPCGPRQDAKHQATAHTGFQSSRSLRTATNHREKLQMTQSISILAVLADRDSSRSAARAKALAFQSSRSLRTATCGSGLRSMRTRRISILAVLADRDWQAGRRGPPWKEISILAVLADRDCL